MAEQLESPGPLTKEFRSSQSLSWMLGVAAVVLWVVLAYVVKADTSDAGAVRVFTPGPGTVVLFALAVTATTFSAAAYAVCWVAVVTHRGNLALWRTIKDAAQD